MFKSNRSVLLLTAMFCFLAFATPAMAEGLESVNTFLETVTTLLKGAGIGIVTIAIMWAGYKLLFQKSGIMEIAPLFAGALLIGGASTIAGYLIPA